MDYSDLRAEAQAAPRTTSQTPHGGELLDGVSETTTMHRRRFANGREYVGQHSTEWSGFEGPNHRAGHVVDEGEADCGCAAHPSFVVLCRTTERIVCRDCAAKCASCRFWHGLASLEEVLTKKGQQLLCANCAKEAQPLWKKALRGLWEL